MAVTLRVWAQRTLADVEGLSEQRLRHIAGVARRADFAATRLVPNEERDVVVSAAWLHDIGYAPGLIDTGSHSIDGALHLLRLGAPGNVVGLVAYHSAAEQEVAARRLSVRLADFPRPRGQLLDLLTYADMTTDPNGYETTAAERLDGILARYAKSDPVHVSVADARLKLLATVQRVQDMLAAHVVA